MATSLSQEQQQKGTRLSHIDVRELVHHKTGRFNLTVLAGEAGLDNKIESDQIHRPGLALAGFLDLFAFDRIQVLGNTEIRYLTELSHENRTHAIKKLMNFRIPCLVITNSNVAPSELIREANLRKIPLLSSDRTTTDFTHLLSDYLYDKFALSITVHGSLVDVYGTGMLITGRSGIGKSEISLDLVERGHRLVSDDTVKIEKKARGILVGVSPELTRHLIEVRGVGLIDVRRMFGVRAVRMQKRVEVEVRLQEWDDNYEWERIGLDQESVTYLEEKIPLVRLPIFPGKNITMIAEVIALNVHLKVYGFNAAEDFNRKLHDEINRQRVEEYLIKDFE